MNQYSKYYYNDHLTVNITLKMPKITIKDISSRSSYKLPVAIGEYGAPIKFFPISEKMLPWKNSTSYQHYFWGTLENREKAMIIVEDIPIYTDVLIAPIPKMGIAHVNNTTDFAKTLTSTLTSNQYGVVKTEIIEAFPFKLFQEKPSNWLRIHFNSIDSREKCIKFLRDNQCITGSDEITRSGYSLKFCRENSFSLSTWNEITNYRIIQRPKEAIPGVTPYMEIGTTTYPLDLWVISVSVDNFRKLENPPTHKPILIMAWDIETYSNVRDAAGNRTNELADGDRAEDTAFAACFVSRWAGEQKSFSRIGLTTVTDIGEYKEGDIIEEADPIEMIMHCGRVIKAKRPDIITDFNGGNFDWPFVIKKLKKAGRLTEFFKLISCSPASWHKNATDEGLWQWNFARKTNIKQAGNMEVHIFQVPGILMVDTMPQFKKLYPDEEKFNLNFYLEKNNLGSKVDMPYLTMFDIYEKASAGDLAAKEEMSDVMHYCMEDSEACQKLWAKRNVILETLAIADKTFVTPENAFFRAGGIKVQNTVLYWGHRLVSHFAHKFNIMFSTYTVYGENDIDELDEKGQPKPKEKYPGAYVPKPIRGRTLEPVGALDFNSMYPSICMADNLSPEKIVTNPQLAEDLISRGYELREIEVPMTSKVHRGWSVWHHNEQLEKGIYPIILEDLRDTRNLLKVQLAAADVVLKAAYAAYRADPTTANQAIIDEAEVKYAAIDASQKAVKVLGNTFYGEAGNQLSPFFMLLVAGGITTKGVICIKMAHKVAQDAGFTLYYGDSVTEDTPILTRNRTTGKINIRTFKSLSYQVVNWVHPDNAPIKWICEDAWSDLDVWSAHGWSRIQRVIKHTTRKRIYRVTTDRGSVDVTEDHSLLCAESLNEITAVDCKIGETELAHSYPADFKLLDEEYASVFEIDIEIDKFIVTQSKHSAAQLYARLLTKVRNMPGHKVVLRSEPEGYYMAISKINDNSPAATNHVRQIELVHDGATPITVYDISTDDGTFQAGIGEMIVHNTDSMYIAPPQSTYSDLVIPANPGTPNYDYETYISYHEERVRRAIAAVKALQHVVNAVFAAFTKTDKVKMGYEEVGCPNFYAGKKMYMFLKHEHGPVFRDNNLNDLIIKGLQFIKRGASKMLQEIGHRITRQILDICTVKDVEQIIIEEINLLLKASMEVSTEARTEWLNLFEKSAVYRPNKQNPTVIRFHNRMKIRELTPPTPGIRFNYIRVLPKEPLYSLEGKTIKYTAGDCMEYTDVARANNYKIDALYYISEAIGVMARLMTYKFRELDDKPASDRAKKMIENYIETVTQNKANRKKTLLAAKRWYKLAYKWVTDCIDEYSGIGASILIKKIIKSETAKIVVSQNTPDLNDEIAIGADDDDDADTEELDVFEITPDDFALKQVEFYKSFPKICQQHKSYYISDTGKCPAINEMKSLIVREDTLLTKIKQKLIYSESGSNSVNIYNPNDIVKMLQDRLKVSIPLTDDEKNQLADDFEAKCAIFTDVYEDILGLMAVKQRLVDIKYISKFMRAHELKWGCAPRDAVIVGYSAIPKGVF